MYNEIKKEKTDFIREGKFDENGERTGLWEIYWNNDKKTLYRKVNYLNGVLHGKYEKYDFTKEGTSFLESVDWYINGEQTGAFESYHPNGKLQAKGEFFHGDLHNLIEQFYDNGKLHIIGKYNRGSLLGIWKEYFKNGKIKNLEFVL